MWPYKSRAPPLKPQKTTLRSVVGRLPLVYALRLPHTSRETGPLPRPSKTSLAVNGLHSDPTSAVVYADPALLCSARRPPCLLQSRSAPARPHSLTDLLVWSGPIRSVAYMDGILSAGGATPASPTSPLSVRHAPNGNIKRKRDSLVESSPGSIGGQEDDGLDNDSKKRQPGVKRACNECRQQKVSQPAPARSPLRLMPLSAASTSQLAN